MTAWVATRCVSYFSVGRNWMYTGDGAGNLFAFNDSGAGVLPGYGTPPEWGGDRAEQPSRRRLPKLQDQEANRTWIYRSSGRFLRPRCNTKILTRTPGRSIRFHSNPPLLSSGVSGRGWWFTNFPNQPETGTGTSVPPTLAFSMWLR